tara:strand:- start:443 stop:838 length:396 start_codon:yes stop_codon:yes gene_type:complete
MQKSSISQKQLREFGFLLGFGIPILIGWILPLISGHHFKAWTLWIGIPSLMLGTFNPKFLFYPYKGWMKLGYVLAWVNSRIILGLVFLLILQPIALIMRVIGYDPLRKNKNTTRSYREVKENHKTNLTRIF